MAHHVLGTDMRPGNPCRRGEDHPSSKALHFAVPSACSRKFILMVQTCIRPVGRVNFDASPTIYRPTVGRLTVAFFLRRSSPAAISSSAREGCLCDPFLNPVSP